MNDNYFILKFRELSDKMLSESEYYVRAREIIEEIRNDERTKIQRTTERTPIADSESHTGHLPERTKEEYRQNEIRAIDSNEREFTKLDQIGEDYL